MNFWKLICGLLGKSGPTVYRTTIDAGKVLAPVVTPLVQAVLTSHGLPTTPGAALAVLVTAAASSTPLPLAQANGLHNYIMAQLPPAA